MLWERTASYGFFALRFHWTPEQVEALPLWYRERLSGFVADHDEVLAEKAKKAAK